MDKDVQGEIMKEQFIKVFLDADNILRKKLKTFEKYAFDYKKQKDEALSQLEILRK